MTSTKFAELIIEKVGVQPLANYFPPIPDKLFKRIGVRSEREKNEVQADAWQFMDTLKRMNEEERTTIYNVLMHGCPTELPDNIHINIDLLRRFTGFTVNKLKRLLGGLQSLGFFTAMREDDETDGHLGKYEMVVLEWHNMNVDGDGNATLAALEMVRGVSEGRCESCSIDALSRLDFSSLATVTTRPHKH